MKNFLLVGIPATGKTHLGQALEKHIRTVVYEPSGERKRDILKKLSITKRLSELNQNESMLINKLYFTDLELRTQYCNKANIVDTHATYQVGKRFVKLLPPDINAIGVILLGAAPKVVKERRIKRGRDRDNVDEFAIQEEAKQEYLCVYKYCRTHGLPYLDINTTNGRWINHLVEAKQFIESNGQIIKSCPSCGYLR